MSPDCELIIRLTSERDLYAEAGRAAELRIVELRAERDALREERTPLLKELEKLEAENDVLKSELEDAQQKTYYGKIAHLTELREAAYDVLHDKGSGWLDSTVYSRLEAVLAHFVVK